MRRYELIFILRPDLGGEEAVTGQVERVQGFIRDQGGSVVSVDQNNPWGRRKLAYEIADQQEGYYVLTHFDLNPSKCDELERSLKLSESILRYLLVRLDETK